MKDKEFLKLMEVVGWLEGEGFLTIKEVAGLLRIHPGTVSAVMKRERVQRHHIGRWVCFKRMDIEKLLERRRVGNE